jgi:hypothetical protein
MAGGAKIQLFLNDRFSLDADLVFGRDYVHLSPGLIGLPLLLLAKGSNEGLSFGGDDGSFTDFLISVALIAISFEHISYHVPLKNNLDISPYLSLLRYKYAYEHGKYSDLNFTGEQMSFATGVQFNKYFGRFVLAPYAEYNIGYSDHISGYNIGLYCGVYLPGK